VILCGVGAAGGPNLLPGSAPEAGHAAETLHHDSRAVLTVTPAGGEK
jgi:hypothetical protein